jgi:hypothetical protein
MKGLKRMFCANDSSHNLRMKIFGFSGLIHRIFGSTYVKSAIAVLYIWHGYKTWTCKGRRVGLEPSMGGLASSLVGLEPSMGGLASSLVGLAQRRLGRRRLVA